MTTNYTLGSHAGDALTKNTSPEPERAIKNQSSFLIRAFSESSPHFQSVCLLITPSQAPGCTQLP